MDKLDNLISKSKQDYAADKSFVDKVMLRVAASKSPKRRHFGRVWSWPPVMASSLAALAILVVAGVTLFGGPSNTSSKKPITANPTKSSSSTQKTTASGTTNPNSTIAAAPAAAGPGTSNATLNSDLNSINSGLNQDSQDLNASNNAVNDQQQAIAVPTD